MTIYRRAIFAFWALLVAPAAAETNFLLLRVWIGDYVLADAVEGEARGGVVYINTAELAAVLEEPPQSAQFAAVSELSKFFPAEFSVNLARQELRVFGYGALGVEKRFLAEYESRVWRPPAKKLPEIAPPRRMFAPPFAAFRHAVERRAEGEYYNADSLHLYGDFAFGEGALAVSEAEGKFSGVDWFWRRDLWRFSGALDENGGYESAALGKRFDAAAWSWNAEVRRRKSEKLSFAADAAKQIFAGGGGSFGVRGGASAGEINSWRLGAAGKLRRADWSADYARYPNAAAGQTDSRQRFGFFLRSFAADHIVRNIRGGVRQSETGARHAFNIAGLGAEWQFRRAAPFPNSGGVALRKHWLFGDAQYGARFSHEREFGRGAALRAWSLSVQREKAGQTGFLEWSQGRGANAEFTAEWRRPFFGDKIFAHAGAVFARREGVQRAFINLSYAAARNPESGRWLVHNGFLGNGAVSVCARRKNGGIFREAALSLKQAGALKDGCAFFPSAGGEVALDKEKLPPWIRAKHSGFFAATRPGVITEINFEMETTGEVEGMVRRGGAPLAGAEVFLIKANAADGAENCAAKDFSEIAEINSEIKPEKDGAIRATRAAFDGYYFFGEVPAGEYCLRAGQKFSERITVKESEILTADINLPSRRAAVE